MIFPVLIYEKLKWEWIKNLNLFFSLRNKHLVKLAHETYSIANGGKRG